MNFGNQTPYVQNNTGFKMPEAITNGYNSVKNTLGNAVSDVSSGVNNMTDNLKNTFSDFSSKNVMNAGSDFLESNTIIAKFVFIILIVIIFVFLIYLGIFLIQFFTSLPKDPFLVKGLLDGSSFVTIQQDPKSNPNKLVNRSNNQTNGIEFTWSVWLYIKNIPIPTSGKDTYQCIFLKGDNNFPTGNNGLSSTNNGPGLYLKSSSNDGNPNDRNVQTAILTFLMDTVTTPAVTNLINTQTNNYDIPNIPIRKWFHIAMRMENNIMDIYINGTITKRIKYDNVPKQNYNNVYVFPNNGFSGQLSNLQYFGRALSVIEINNIIYQGVNLTQYTSMSTKPNYDYIASSWYDSIGTNS
jgi:hypothetical protein